jgi:hypothetical protein
MLLKVMLSDCAQTPASAYCRNSDAKYRNHRRLWSRSRHQRRHCRFALGAVEMDEWQGDIEIKQSLVIKGIKNASGSKLTSVGWRSGAAQGAALELLGDYNGDGYISPADGDVDAADYVAWQNSLGSMTDLRAEPQQNRCKSGTKKEQKHPDLALVSWRVGRDRNGPVSADQRWPEPVPQQCSVRFRDAG